MVTIFKLTIASTKVFVRSRQALFFALVMPLIIMFVFGYVGFDRPVKVEVGLVTHRPTQQTRDLIAQLKQFPTFVIYEGALESEKTEMQKGNRAVVLDVPDAAIARGLKEPAPTITAYVNAGKQGEAQTVIAVVDRLIDRMTLAAAALEPIARVEPQQVSARNLRYMEFLLPGLIALSVMQMSVLSVASLFTQYREKGVLKRLMATPMRPFQLVAASAISRLMVSLAQAVILIVTGLVLFNAHVVGSYLLVLLCVAVGALMFLGLGFSVSGLARSAETVPAMANLIVFPMLFLGGTFFPISNMPWWLQIAAKRLPLTYFSTALRDVMTTGAGFWDISSDLLAMAVWAMVLITVATVTFRFREGENA